MSVLTRFSYSRRALALGRDRGEAVAVLQAVHDADQELHDQVVLFLQALAVEVGAVADSGKPLPGKPSSVTGSSAFSTGPTLSTAS